ncbi:FXYD domain containing ion transport regulator 6 like isoform X2 [Sardina pilchardus]|uniref:FXYD domain containing ion transport regulator 6 like isoform X2 n=1 Tax=Sardina pilchardus TaxID=27697 RepID=UPI002E0DA762
MDLSVLAAFCACLGPVLASSVSHDDHDHDPFYYDYESLRIGGLVFAVTLCIMGLVLILTRKCTCNSNKPSPKPGCHDPEAPIVQS